MVTALDEGKPATRLWEHKRSKEIMHMFKTIAENECVWIRFPRFGNVKNDMVTPAKRMITGTSMEVDGHKPTVPFVR